MSLAPLSSGTLLRIRSSAIPTFAGARQFGFDPGPPAYQMIPQEGRRSVQLTTGRNGGALSLPRNVRLVGIENKDRSNHAAQSLATSVDAAARAGTRFDALAFPSNASLQLELRGDSTGLSAIRFFENGGGTVVLQISVKPTINEIIHTATLMTLGPVSTRSEKELREIVARVADTYLLQANVKMTAGKHFNLLTEDLLPDPAQVGTAELEARLFISTKNTAPGEAFNGSILLCGIWSLTNIFTGPVNGISLTVTGELDGSGEPTFRDNITYIGDKSGFRTAIHEFGHNHGLKDLESAEITADPGNLMVGFAVGTDRREHFNRTQIDAINPLGLDLVE